MGLVATIYPAWPRTHYCFLQVQRNSLRPTLSLCMFWSPVPAALGSDTGMLQPVRSRGNRSLLPHVQKDRALLMFVDLEGEGSKISTGEHLCLVTCGTLGKLSKPSGPQSSHLKIGVIAVASKW